MSSRNPITCDVLANIKGDREKYEAGYDAIFRKNNPVEQLVGESMSRVIKKIVEEIACKEINK